MRVLLFFLVTLGPGLAIGQTNPNTPTQKNLSLQKKFDAFRNHQLDEKIFIHTDRSFYLTGEIIWLNLYCVYGPFHRPLGISKVAYVEVVDANQKAVLQTKIELKEDGCGSGTLLLPVSMNSGHYLIRAYTNWMKNFSSGLYYQQLITVVNPFTPLATTTTSNPGKYDAQFFPEGGNLVEGLPSVVGFRAVNRNGLGIDFRGAILNEKNDTIVRISPLRFGIGRFAFTPLRDHQYRAVITDSDGKSFSYPLPAPLEEGMVLRLTETSDKITITVKTKSVTPTVLHLLTHTRQVITFLDKQFVINGEAVFRMDKKALGDGVSHITVFNDDMTPMGERLYFKKPTRQLAITVEPELPGYAPRKRVNLTIRAGGANPHLSMAVVRVDSLEESGQNIVNYLYLSSELKGNIESPGYYFENDNTVERKEVTDNLMLTHGWTRFKWEDVFLNKQPMGFVPEYGGHILQGQLRARSGKTPAANILTYLTSSGAYNARPYLARSNGQGKLLFEIQNFYGNNELTGQTNTGRDSLYEIEILNPFSESKSEYVIPGLTLNRKSMITAEQRSIHMQVQNIFHKNERSIFKRPAFDSVAFYGTPDEKYYLDDYTRFPTMEEVLREYVRGVQVRKTRGSFRFMNYDMVNRTFFGSNPLVMLDGVPVFDIDKIMTLDPHLVKSVEVMNRRWYLGASTVAGIVSYKTYRGDLGGFQPGPLSLSQPYEGLQLEREFFSPRYETTQQTLSTLPDTRDLLYWSFSVPLDQDGKNQIQFYTSDVVGKYKVVVQGIDKDGIPGYSSAFFEVTE